MTIQKTTENKTVTLTVSGRLDTASAPELEKELETCLEGTEQLIFDLKDLLYTSSAGRRLLVKTQKIMDKQGTMKLIHVNDDVMEVFDITGFLDILTVE